MFVFKGSKKHGNHVSHYRYVLRLEQALAELFNLYDEMGGPMPQAGALIDDRIERCLGEPHAAREAVHCRMHTLLRSKDLHHYMMEDADLAPLKYGLLEHILFHREAEGRWVAIRDLLLSHLDSICETALPGSAGNQEIYKRQLSSRNSRLGKMLLTTALFNFDMSHEEPPPNLSIRFKKRHFPEHTWEIRDGGERAGVSLLALADWCPEDVLCRWEYLSTDLAHALFRSRQRPVQSPRAWGGESELHHEGTARVGTKGEKLYCRLATEGSDTRQLELLPFKPESLLPELQRLVHRRHGESGVRILAALLDRFDRSQPGRAVTFSLCRIAEAAFGALGTGRTALSRLRKVHDVLERIGEVECQRILDQDGMCTLRASRLATLLERARNWKSGSGENALPAGSWPNWDEATAADQEVRLLLDPVFYPAPGHTLASAYRDIPPEVLPGEGKGHPYRLALYIFLRATWSGEAGAPRTVELSARSLFREAGLWLNESSPYRPLELLKRELHHLREAGWISGWKIERGAIRNPLEDRYRLAPPGPLPKTYVPPPWKEAATPG